MVMLSHTNMLDAGSLTGNIEVLHFPPNVDPSHLQILKLDKQPKSQPAEIVATSDFFFSHKKFFKIFSKAIFLEYRSKFFLIKIGQDWSNFVAPKDNLFLYLVELRNKLVTLDGFCPRYWCLCKDTNIYSAWVKHITLSFGVRAYFYSDYKNIYNFW